MKMDLFSNTNGNPVMEKILGKSWYEQLNPIIDWSKVEDTLKMVTQERINHLIYPNNQDIFRAFNIIPFEKIRVVIIGQDPYHNGNADGLAFSCSKGLSPSLKQIFTAMFNDLKPDEETIRKYSYDASVINLDYLAKQGVFLFNPILTVRQGTPNSHKGFIWNYFTSNVLKCLLKKKELIWLIWGNTAKEYLETAMKQNNDLSLKGHTILKCEHPAAASHSNRIWTCNHFSTVNKILSDNPIKWLNYA